MRGDAGFHHALNELRGSSEPHVVSEGGKPEDGEYWRRQNEKCPTCSSPRPGLHPSTQPDGGEVQICPDPWHTKTDNGWHQRGDEERRHHPSREVGAETHVQVEKELELHVFQDAEGAKEWVIWLNMTTDFDGLVLASGPDVDAVIREGSQRLRRIADALERTTL